MSNNKLRTSLLALLLIGAFAACHSPTAPPNTTTATLSLLLPDSAHVFDTVTFRAHYSGSIQPSWKFEWQFGDSSSASTKDTSTTHIYDSAGTYNVQVTLVDSLGKEIAKESGKLTVLPLIALTLTLTMQDSIRYGDRCAATAVASTPLRPGWSFQWNWGDSTDILAKDSINHFYQIPGIYIVHVSLIDMNSKLVLAKDSTIVTVFTPPFDPSLLQSMRNLRIECSGNVIVATSGSNPPWADTGVQIFSTSTQLKWKALSFGEDSNMASSDTSPNSQFGTEIDQWTNQESLSGTVDLSPTTVSLHCGNSANRRTTYLNAWGEGTSTSGSENMSFENIPLKSESDSEIVFEANGPLITNPSFQSSNTFTSRFTGQSEKSVSIDWNDSVLTPRVTITFSKH